MKLRTLDDVMVPAAPATAAEWEKMRSELIANLRFASSIDLLKHDAPLNAKVFDAAEHDGFVVEKVIFQSLPGFYVTGSLYRPKDTTKKYPAVLNPHGHWTHGRIEIEPLARIPQRCANLAMRGMVAFIYDMIGFNDSQQIPHNAVCPEWEKWNYGRFALQLNNSVKAVDFVSSLPYVDADRIGCTGCSGGGTQTYFLAALDQRIKAAAPINMASTRMQGGCCCENTAFLRTTANNIDYTMTIAPRPLFMSGSDGDWTVNSETVEFPAVEKLYALLGAADRYEHFYQSAPHCYNLPIRERVYDFFCRNFGIENRLPNEVDFEIDTDSLLIGDIRPHVPAEGFVENDGQLFDVVRGIIRANLEKLTAEEKADLRRRVYLLDREFECDIPYVVMKEDTAPVFRFGACPAPADTCGIHFPHCYNDAEDARRVSAVAALMRANPDALFAASGKSAALLSVAAGLTGHTKLALTGIDCREVFIPGSALVC